VKGRRPWKRWAVEFEEDLNVKGLRNWHAVARDWKACRKIVLSDKARNGGWCCGRKSSYCYGLLTKLRAAAVVTFVTACYIVM
jgi:hypothetical protein